MLYVGAGYSVEQFWAASFRELGLHMRAAIKREERATNARIELAHATAVLTRADEIPPLAELLIGDAKKQAIVQSRKQETRAWRQFALANGVSAKQWAEAEAQAKARRPS